ncbi:MAG TPA: hypothetical protein VEX38_03120 [Fimbriimonadaceae bacterium]|nr:hypothetical protein [Fimbriimonadaceae bacterium]
MAYMKLSCLGEGMHGRVGNVVFLRTLGGTQVRELQIPSDPETPKQFQARRAMTIASRFWRELSTGEMKEWHEYAQAQAVRRPGQPPLVPRADRLFVGLSAKLLQMGVAPDDLPRTPPVGTFPGDAVRVEASPAPNGALPDGEESDSPYVLDNARRITFTANLPNAQGVVTELLLQRLPRPYYRTYLEKYRTAGFVAFQEDGLEATVQAPYGRCFACAYRFVEASSGRMTGLIEVGVVSFSD